MSDYVKKVAEEVRSRCYQRYTVNNGELEAIIASVPKPEPVAHIPLTADLAKSIGLKRVFHETALLSEYIWVDQNGKEVLEIPVYNSPVSTEQTPAQRLTDTDIKNFYLKYDIDTWVGFNECVRAIERKLKGEG